MSKQSASLSETLFPVTEYPATFADGDNKEFDGTGYKFIMREDTHEVLSCMTDDYRLVTNKSLIDKAAPVLKDNGAKIRECSVYNGGRKTVWRWTFPKTKIDIGNGDMVNPEIAIINSYDGSSEVHTYSGAFRLVCSNGLIIGFTLSRSKSKHSIWNKSLDNIDKTIVDTITATNDILVESLPLLKETKINRSHVKKVVKMMPTYAMDALTQYLLAHSPQSYWDLLNAMTYITTHHMGRQRGATLKVENEIYPAILKMAKTVNKNVAIA